MTQGGSEYNTLRIPIGWLSHSILHMIQGMHVYTLLVRIEILFHCSQIKGLNFVKQLVWQFIGFTEERVAVRIAITKAPERKRINKLTISIYIRIRQNRTQVSHYKLSKNGFVARRNRDMNVWKNQSGQPLEGMHCYLCFQCNIHIDSSSRL